MKIDHKIINGSTIAYAGSLHDEKLLIIAGRHNYRKASGAIDALISRLHALGMTIVWFESRATATSRLLDARYEKHVRSRIGAFLKQDSTLGNMARKASKALFLLRYPSRWDYFSASSRGNARHAAELRALIKNIGNGKTVIVLSHSAGGIISSYIEDEPSVERLICFGYPFKHPEKEDEPARTDHLASMRKPFLIIQGRQDEYGGTEVLANYRMSPAISVSFIDSDHNYEDISQESQDRLVAEISEFMGEGRDRHAA
ncbi:MAG: hypothetical protein HGA47_10825 [Zoogloea sp.]|nr:hypothetical protein [Zoogloea sp.]